MSHFFWIIGLGKQNVLPIHNKLVMENNFSIGALVPRVATEYLKIGQIFLTSILLFSKNLNNTVPSLIRLYLLRRRIMGNRRYYTRPFSKIRTKLVPYVKFVRTRRHNARKSDNVVLNARSLRCEASLKLK